VFSPHLDDAALSAGAFIADLATASARRVELHTLFAGSADGEISPAARGFHRMCSLHEDAVQQRRGEDNAAAATLGADAYHHGFLDAIYRRDPSGGWLCRNERSVFSELPDEPDLRVELAAVVAELCVIRRPALVLTCAAIGGHVDHRLTRAAVVEATSRARVRLLLWEDLPHAMRRPGDNTTGRPRPHHATPDAWDWKWAAIARYQSQVSMLWPDGRDWRAELAAHAIEQGGGFRPAEMLWEPR